MAHLETMVVGGKVAMLLSMVGVMLPAQWVVLVGMAICTAKAMGLTLQHLALLYSTMA